MVIYLIIFILSLICINIGEKFEFCKKYVIGRMFYTIGLLIPAILAGMRDYSIGTDVNVYGIPMFNTALGYSSLNDYILHNSEATLAEPLYGIMNFIISRFTTNPFWILFIIALIINYFIFLGWYKYKNKIPLWFGMLLFYFTYYNLSLNMMRQCIAMSIIFYSIHFIFEGKIKRYYLWVIIAIGFHTSSIIALTFFPFYTFVNLNFTIKYKKVINPMIIFLVIFCILLISPITRYLVSIGLIRENYVNYLSGNVFGSEFNIKLVVLSIIELIVIILPPQYIKEKYSKYNYMLIMSTIGFVLSQLTFISRYIVRIGYYFLFIRMYLYATIPYLFDRKKNKLLFMFMIIIYFIFYWMYIYCYSRLNATFPYKVYSG